MEKLKERTVEEFLSKMIVRVRIEESVETESKFCNDIVIPKKYGIQKDHPIKHDYINFIDNYINQIFYKKLKNLSSQDIFSFLKHHYRAKRSVEYVLYVKNILDFETSDEKIIPNKRKKEIKRLLGSIEKIRKTTHKEPKNKVVVEKPELEKIIFKKLIEYGLISVAKKEGKYKLTNADKTDLVRIVSFMCEKKIISIDCNTRDYWFYILTRFEGLEDDKSAYQYFEGQKFERYSSTKKDGECNQALTEALL